MRIALRTALATAVVAGVALTPALTAGAAFAADAPKPAEAGAAAPADNPLGEFVRTEALLDGLTAKVYKLGEGHHVAEILRGEEILGTLEADKASGKDMAYGQYATVGVQLFSNGDLLSVRAGEGRPQGERVKRYEFSHGYNGVVFTTAPGVFTAEIDKNGTPIGTLSMKPTGPTRDEKTFGAITVTLHWDGSLTAVWHGDKGDEPAPKAGTALTKPKVTGCAVRQEFASVFPHMTVQLVNHKDKGPWAVLVDDKGKVVSKIDRKRPADSANGLKITGADTYTAKFGQRHEGGDTPFTYVDFPKLPEECTKQATPAPAPATQGNQTTVVPKGGVAAGAEVGQQGGDTVLLASAAAATAAAAVLGFVAVRRRAAANV